MYFNTLFNRFFVVWASKNEAKIDHCSLLFRKRRFDENHWFCQGKSWCLRFRASKNARKINAKTRSTKASQKNLPESILASIFAPPKHPNSLPKTLKSLRKAMLNEACVATLCNSPTNRPKAAGLGALGLSPWSFKGLGLLDLSFVALILNASF